jgi:DNA-directed RNA polymerase subunit beta'
VADANYLYRELFDANANLKELTSKVDDVGEERLGVYDALKAVTGLGDPTHPKNQERQVKGALRSIFGSSPKQSFVQRKLLSGTTDLVGRAVIIPDPDLDMDSAGIPEARAWEVYKPFLVRRLVRSGLPRLNAMRAVDEKSHPARQALLKEMSERPVILNRAPVLHRYGVMAFWPKLVKGDSLRINPFVTTGFGADFDGDQMNYSVPVESDAVHDAVHKMLPSRNLYASSNFKVHYVPSKEFAGGLYAATASKDAMKPEKTFAKASDAIAAYHRGEIGVDHPVKIIDHNS